MGAGQIFGALRIMGITSQIRWAHAVGLSAVLLCSGGALAQGTAANSAAGFLQQGTAAMRRGDLSTAESAFRSAAQAQPNRAEAYLGLGLVELRKGDALAAADALGRAGKLDARLGGAHLFLGIAQYQLGMTDDAVASLRAELALNPTSIEASTWLTIVLLAADRAEEAIPVVDRAVMLKPEDSQLLYLQAKAHGLIVKSALAKLFAQDPDSALVHRASAENYAGAGDTEKAITEFQAALHKEPDSPDLLEALGEAQQKGGHAEAAAGTFARELTLNPNSAVALYDLGRIDVEGGKPADGVALLRRAQAAHAVASPTDFYLGLGLAELGQNAEAERWLKAALEANPPEFVQQGAWYQLARVYQRLNRKEEARDSLAHLKTVLDAQNQAKEVTAKAARAQSPETESSRP